MTSMNRIFNGPADLIIFGGQSNMQGQTERLSECEPVEGALEYRFLEDALVPLKNPVGENIRYDGTRGWPIMKDDEAADWLRDNVLGSACYGNTNMVPSFCREYIKETGRSVVAVHAAKGSTSIRNWLPGNAGFDMLIRKSLAAMDKISRDNIAVAKMFFVWLQGESDAINGCSTEEYTESLMELQAALKEKLYISAFGIIRAGYFTNDSRDEAVMKAQEDVCLNRPGDFIMLTRLASDASRPEGRVKGEEDENNEGHEDRENGVKVKNNRFEGFMHPFIGGHFSAYGLEQIGADAGKTLAKSRECC